ncbi:MAG TPA: VWA domain-containing protein [Pyrinomonadaceae bacterium]|nr:VWA domain-containing protein [Pyrinomonadaceae bacterium]
MKFCPLILVFLLVAGAFAQSGRIKPADSPTPSPTPRRTGAYNPTQPVAVVPTPTATPKIDEDNDIVRVSSVVVPIPASVFTASGGSVTNLKITDFELKIDGKQVEVAELFRSESPIRLAMLFDNSESVLIARNFEKDAAIKFFRSVIRPEKDMASLYSVSTVSRLEQPFTRSISSLIYSIESFPVPAGATALLDGIDLAADYLGEVEGRRVMVIVSDGDDTASDISLETAVRALQVVNCQVFIVKTTDFENYMRTGSRKGNANIRQLIAERRMLEIAAQTGGAVYSPLDQRELQEAFRDISGELQDQYILTYYPDDEPGKQGEFRKISLTVKRPHLTVRTRKGYYVGKN